MQLSLKDLKAQTYDGASKMFGKDTGVSVHIAAQQSKALSTHCYGHSLNLRIRTTIPNSKQMKDVMGTLTISLVNIHLKEKICLGTLTIFFILSPYILMMRLK